MEPMASDGSMVVVVEDDEHIAELVELYLRQDGHDVHRAGDAVAAMELVRARQPSLVVLDIGLPGEIDGLELCRRLRATSRVPIILLTARDTEIDRVVGLELGADDYVTKPFSPRELVARVKAVLRRSDAVPTPAAEPPLRLGGLVVDPARREVHMGGREVQLTAREFDLLAHLVRNRGIVLTRDQILERVWGWRSPGDTRTVDVHIRQVRAKLGDEAPIRTVRGVGYKAEAPP
jgi:DNA-binding response OmpR family regulator